MTTSIFKAKLDTPFGMFSVAVASISIDARADIYTAAQSELKIPIGLLRVGEVEKSNRKLLASMTPIKNANSYTSGQWGWIKKL